MKTSTVTNTAGESFELTIQEEKYFRAIKRLEKMSAGRLRLFGSGTLSIRINDDWYNDEIYSTSIYCEGGDGGDNH